MLYWLRLLFGGEQRILAAIAEIRTDIRDVREAQIMAQSDIDNITNQLNDLKTALDSDVTDITNEFQALNDKVAQGGTVTPEDLTGLQTAVDSLKGTVANVTAIDTANTQAPADPNPTV